MNSLKTFADLYSDVFTCKPSTWEEIGKFMPARLDMLKLIERLPIVQVNTKTTKPFNVLSPIIDDGICRPIRFYVLMSETGRKYIANSEGYTYPRYLFELSV